MDKKQIIKITSTLLLSVVFCVSCSQQKHDSSIKEATYSVHIIENNKYYDVISSNPMTIKRGENASFEIQLKEDIGITSLTHQGQEVEMSYINNPSNTTTITIPNIHYSASYHLNCFEAEYTINYYPNGGNYFDLSDSSLPYTMHYSKKNRLRPNTEIGTNRIYRSGYVLNGWTTGDNDRTGLGSRISMPESKNLSLYAIWEKESSLDNFDFLIKEDGVHITSYHGNEEKVVVPSYYRDSKVVSLDYGAFQGNEKEVILPSTIETIQYGAFLSSKIQELYFYDNISNISNDSFIGCLDFSTIHINAILAPRYGSKNLFSEINLADKYDILIANKDNKKLISYGGSGTYLSMNTKTIENAFNNEYVCINMAVNGWFNGVAQFEMMLPYLKEGDIFIHTPETSSQFGLLYGNTMVPEIENFNYNKFRFFSTLETNFDLISLIDYRHIDDLLTGFNMFNAERKTLKETTYEDYKTDITMYGTDYHNEMAYIDERGNWAFDRPALKGEDEAGEADIVVEYITDETAHNRLNSYYNQIKNKGVTLYYSNAGINRDTLELRLSNPELFDGEMVNDHLYYGRPKEIPAPDYESLDKWVEIYQQAVEDYLDVDVLIPLKELLYSTSDYFEPDYHLSDRGSEHFTTLFIEALKERGLNK